MPLAYRATHTPLRVHRQHRAGQSEPRTSPGSCKARWLSAAGAKPLLRPGRFRPQLAVLAES
eukprot:290633-Prymnesium_polylepis.1